MIPIALFIALIFLHSLVSGRLARTVVTVPILFAGAGMVAVFCLPGLRDQEADLGLWLHVAELGLVLLLFADASRTDLQVLKRTRNLPVRLLSVGMLLTIVLGGLAALVIFRQLTLWEAGILAAILAPTDAGLGQVIVNSPRVPIKIREALNVEAGLNDGLAVPFLLFFIALAVTSGDGHSTGLAGFMVEQLGYGALLGVGIGTVGGGLLGIAQNRNWMADSWVQLGVVALPLLCMLASDAIGASMFIAAFVAGLAAQNGFKAVSRHSVEFTEAWGQLFNLSVFFLFGMTVARHGMEFQWTHWLYAVMSLTLLRMVPVALSLIGSRLSPASVIFMGWFGPRGLASIVLALVFLEHVPGLPANSTIRMTVLATVFLSIFAHGFSALPGIRLYANQLAGLGADAPENQENDEWKRKEHGMAPSGS